MSEQMQDEMYRFLETAVDNVKNGMSHRDAMDLAAVTIGGNIPSIVSQATYKYQEATNTKMELSHEKNVDEFAMASMGKLWHKETFDSQKPVTLEDILAQSVYLILKYSQNKNALEEALKANKQIAGAQEARAMAIEMILSV